VELSGPPADGAITRAELLEVAYSRASSPEEARAAARELARLDAVDPLESASDDPSGCQPQEQTEPAQDEDAGRSSRGVRSRAGVALIGAVAVVCLAVGLAVGTATHPSTATPTRSTAPTQSTIASLDPSLGVVEQSKDYFDSPQTASDKPGVAVPAGLDATSFRNVQPGIDLEHEAKAFVAKDSDGHLCLAAVVDRARLVSTCVSGSSFPASGLTLLWTESAGSASLSWYPDGALAVSNTPE
jgi:hypothetical protein